MINGSRETWIGLIRRNTECPKQDLENGTCYSLNTDNNAEFDSIFCHLKDIKQSYWKHFKDAIHYSCTCLYCSGILLVHAVYPDAFTALASKTLSSLLEKMTEKRSD